VRGKRGVAAGRARAGQGARRTAYVPSANRASCPAEVTILRAGGRAAGAPASCPPCGARLAERRRGAGEKRRWRGRAGPRRGRAGGGRTGRLCWRSPQRCGPGGNGKVVTVTSPPLGDRGTADHPPAPKGGVPLRALEVGLGNWGRGRGVLRVGRGNPGLPKPDSPGACHLGQGKGRKRLTADNKQRLAPLGPSVRGRRPPRSQSSPRNGNFQALGGRAEPPRLLSPVPGASPKTGTREAVRSRTCELCQTPAKTWPKESAP
jgi:hypothetical protein